MPTSEKTALQNGPSLQYRPVIAQQRLPFREALLLIYYHLRLLNWWLFLLAALGFVGSGALLWLQLHTDSPQGMSDAIQLSQFVLESGAGLLMGMLASSLIVGDSLLEVTITTRAGMSGVVIWRYLLTFVLLMGCSAAYLAWSLGNGISYAHRQGPLFLLLVWLVPVLAMSMLGLFCSLATRNAALGTLIAALPLAGELIFHGYLLPIQATHPFIIPYTAWGADAPDWWMNRLVLLGIALLLAAGNWWLLRREERLLGNLQ